MKRLILMTCLAAVCVVAGCVKDNTANPCDQLLTQPSPDKVALKFVDKQSGESLIGTAGLTKESIIVTDVATGEVYKNWGIIQHQIFGEGNGAMELIFFPTKAGNVSYRIALGSKGEAVLKLNVDKHKSSSPCGGDYFTVGDYETVQEYNYLENNGIVYKTVLIVKI